MGRTGQWKEWHLLGWVLACLAVCGCVESPQEQSISIYGDSPWKADFQNADSATGVPAAILAGIFYSKTRFRVAHVEEHAHHQASEGAYALSVVASPSEDNELAIADLRHSAIMDVAHQLKSLRAEHAKGTWMSTLALWGGQELAFDVCGHLMRGIIGEDRRRHRILIPAIGSLNSLLDGCESSIQLMSTSAEGFPGVPFVAAHPDNFDVANRGASSINQIVIHTTEGAVNGTIAWFKDPVSRVSAHYVLRSSDGAITQMVADKDIAYHARCSNTESIGIEHEGFVAESDAWYTEAMYLASAKLTAWLGETYGIPMDAQHVISHTEASGDCSIKSDPGPGWDWAHYFDLVDNFGVASLSADFEDSGETLELQSGETADLVVTFTNWSNIAWDINATRLVTQLPPQRSSGFYDSETWVAPSSPGGPTGSVAAQGGKATFQIRVRAPSVQRATEFEEHFQLTQDGVTFGPIAQLRFLVRPSSEDDGGGLTGSCAPCQAKSGHKQGVLYGIALLLAFLSASRRRRQP